MIRIETTASVEIDKSKINAANSDDNKKSLKKFGAFVRRRIQTSLRYKKRRSRPGEPPTVWRTERFKRKKKSKGITIRQPSSPLRELIAFALTTYDGMPTVITGPMIFRNSRVGGGKATRALEFGGTVPFMSHGKPKMGKFLPRPYVAPAFKAELPKAPKLFKKSGW